MTEFTIRKTLAAPKKAVWDKLSDFGNVAVFHPMVERASLHGERACGLGAKRTCVFYNGKGHVEEEVTGYREGESMTVKMLKSHGMPLKQAEVRFDVRDAGGGKTEVALTVRFEMKGGIIGAVMGPIMMKPMMKKMLGDVLKGLETNIQTGKRIGFNGELEARAG